MATEVVFLILLRGVSRDEKSGATPIPTLPPSRGKGFSFWSDGLLIADRVLVVFMAVRCIRCWLQHVMAGMRVHSLV